MAKGSVLKETKFKMCWKSCQYHQFYVRFRYIHVYVVWSCLLWKPYPWEFSLDNKSNVAENQTHIHVLCSKIIENSQYSLLFMNFIQNVSLLQLLSRYISRLVHILSIFIMFYSFSRNLFYFTGLSKNKSVFICLYKQTNYLQNWEINIIFK